MGTSEPTRQFDGDRPVVAFDFDGTLTTKDSFTAFLAWKAGPWGYFIGLARLLPHLAAFAFHGNRGRLKAAAIARFLGGMTETNLAEAAEKFAVLHAQSMFRPDALKAWRNWRSQGALLAIVTASPEITVQPFARGLGADILIGTRLAVDDNDRITGKLDGLNCRGAEKVVRLNQALGEGVHLAAAYGDTKGDLDMLRIAEVKGYRIFKGKP
jgi:phosphatidylglycerophosphatase C